MSNIKDNATVNVTPHPILSISRRPEGVCYCVKVVDPKVQPYGYDLVDVLLLDNGAVCTRSANRLTRTPGVATRVVKAYRAADLDTRARMRGHGDDLTSVLSDQKRGICV